MAIIRMKSEPPILSPEEILELEEAEKRPLQYDEDCPPMTDEMLKQFRRMDSINIPLSKDDAQIVKTLGANYRRVLSKLLSLALSDKEMLKKCM